MNPRNQESAVKYNQELIDLILNTESLAPLLTNATRIIDTLNKNNELNVITEELTKNENYATLKQVTIISDYFNQVEKCVVMHFINHVFKDSKEISTLQKIFCAIWIMQTLYQTNRDLYKIFSQFTENKIPPFTVVYGPKADKKTDQVTYQFLFDPLAKKWECRRSGPESDDEQIKDKILQVSMEKILAYITPENLNPFIKKSLLLALKKHESRYQSEQNRKRNKQLFKEQSRELAPKLKGFFQNNLSSLAILDKIHVVYMTYIENIKEKPVLMVNLLLDDRLFELVNGNSLELILLLTKTVEWSQLQNLLHKEFIKRCSFDMDSFELMMFCSELERSNKRFPEGLSKFFFEQVDGEQLGKASKFPLYKLVEALSDEDFIKYRKQGKIQFAYPDNHYIVEKLYQSRTTEFPNILEEMLTSGEVIFNIPKDKKILKHFVNLLFKYEGQWLYLISESQDSIIHRNCRADLLSLAMETDPQKTLAVIKALTQEDSQGNKFLPINMTAEDITRLVSQSPENACILLDYADILATFEQETFSDGDSRAEMPTLAAGKIKGKARQQEAPSANLFDGIRRFDLLNNLLINTPASYGEKLLRRGLLFAERGMPHFQHLTEFGSFGSVNPSRFISSNFQILYDALSCPTFMSALTEGLMRNQNVDRLFLKEIANIDLLELAKVLAQFQHIKHVELFLSFKDNQDNIINFFALMRKTNPHLNYHIQLEISKDKKLFEFITNYLSNSDIKIITLTIKPKDEWIRALLLDHNKPDLKKFLDACIKKICQNNFMLRRVSVSGLSRSLFFDNGRPGYTFAEFPNYNTHLFSMDALESFSAEEKDEVTENLLRRNRNIYALKAISNQLRHFQNVLELLPWFTIYRMPPELAVDIFNRLNYQHSLSSRVSPYRAVLDSIEQSRAKSAVHHDMLSQLENGLAEVRSFLKASLLKAYYRYKPHKENIHVLEEFFGMGKLQSQVVNIIADWYKSECQDVANMLDEFCKLNQAITAATPDQLPTSFAKRSLSPLIRRLDGVLVDDQLGSMISRLSHYQKAVIHALKQLRREAYVEFQHQGPLNTSMWDTLASQSFDGIELRDVLIKYDPKNDISKSSNIFLKRVSQVFTDFNKAEKTFFENIMQTLALYLKQKEKPQDKQCDRHKHLHKNNLFNLIKEDNIAVFQNSKPRLYQILQMQQKRLAASVSKCSVKLVLRYSGLFSDFHEKKKAIDETIISNYEDQINKKVLQK